MIRYAEDMGKPPRGPIITEREKTIGVRVSPEEYEAIKALADADGLRVASYARMLLLRAAKRAADDESKAS